MGKVNRTVGNLLMCVAEIVIGILLLVDPIGFSKGILAVIGCILAVFGVLSLVRYFRADPLDAAQESGLVKGILFLLLGCTFVFKSEWFIVAFPLLTAFYGVITLVNGVSKIQWAIDMLRIKQRYWYVAFISAALTILFAVLILANPFATTAVLWTFIGVTLVIEAVIDAVTFVMEKMAMRHME